LRFKLVRSGPAGDNALETRVDFGGVHAVVRLVRKRSVRHRPSHGHLQSRKLDRSDARAARSSQTIERVAVACRVTRPDIECLLLATGAVPDIIVGDCRRRLATVVSLRHGPANGLERSNGIRARQAISSLTSSSSRTKMTHGSSSSQTGLRTPAIRFPPVSCGAREACPEQPSALDTYISNGYNRHCSLSDHHANSDDVVGVPGARVAVNGEWSAASGFLW